MQKKDAIEKLFSISLKIRIFREWQTAKTASDKEFSEREIITLELINVFDKIAITEKKLSMIFGLTPSSVTDIAKRLISYGLIEKEVDEKDVTRGKALRITKKGKEQIKQFKIAGTARYAYLFTKIKDEEVNLLFNLLTSIDEAATDAIKKNIFDIWSE